MPTSSSLAASLVVLSSLVACGGGGDPGGPDAGLAPTDVEFGDTALVVVLNPAINEGNDRDLPEPGEARAGVRLEADDGIAATTDDRGEAVLAPLTAGTRTITVTADGVDATFDVAIGDGELREIALAAAGDRAEIMVSIDYGSDQVVELSPAMSNDEINDALSVSDTLVFFAGGEYVGDLDFSGSKVTLFGEGALGGEVTIDGDVIISGSDGRVRGTRIKGDLTIPASGVGLSFARVDGATSAEGSDATFLANALCGDDAVSGSGTLAVGNAGLAPTTACP
jgi:hypothetical protein